MSVSKHHYANGKVLSVSFPQRNCVVVIKWPVNSYNPAVLANCSTRHSQPKCISAKSRSLHVPFFFSMISYAFFLTFKTVSQSRLLVQLMPVSSLCPFPEVLSTFSFKLKNCLYYWFLHTFCILSLLPAHPSPTQFNPF